MRKLRKKLGITQNAIRQACGIPNWQNQLLEKGIDRLTPQQRDELILFLKIEMWKRFKEVETYINKLEADSAQTIRRE